LINKIYLKSILLCSVILWVLAFPQSVKAQELSGAFIMSSVGSIPNFSNNSMPIAFTSNSSCFTLQNGVAVLIGQRGSGFFATSCIVSTKYNTLGVHLFPNPVSANTKVKFQFAPPLNDDFTISIWNMKGIRLSAIKSTGYEIFQGKLMDFSALPTGTFILQIESQNYSDALKFIKAK
jgi:hypothetical protein